MQNLTGAGVIVVNIVVHMKSETETYADHLIFTHLPTIT